MAQGLSSSAIPQFMWPTWGPPGSYRPQMGPMLVPGTLLSGTVPYMCPDPGLWQWTTNGYILAVCLHCTWSAVLQHSVWGGDTLHPSRWLCILIDSRRNQSLNAQSRSPLLRRSHNPDGTPIEVDCPYPLEYIRIFNTLRPRKNGRHFADDVLNAFSWMKMYEFHWILFLSFELAISQHWFR